MSDLEPKKTEPQAAAPKAVAVAPIRVKATAPGFTHRYINQGEEFEIDSIDKLGSWMAPVNPADEERFTKHRAKVAAEKAERLAKAAKAKAAEKA
jgi:hypothetical protein